jgi:hypothetical protein
MGRSKAPLGFALALAAAIGISACEGTIGPGGPGGSGPGAGDQGPGGSGGGGGGASSGDRPSGMPFEAFSVKAYVAKVKNTLVGLPPTADEIAQVTADPTTLASLIDKWMALPQYRTQMLSFFANAFQQTQFTSQEFQFQIPADDGVARSDPAFTFMMTALRESFARTVLQLIDEGRPFNEAITTRRFMLTPPLLAMYAYIDAAQFDDAGNALPQNVPANFKITITGAGPIPIEQTLDPASPNYMTFYNNNVNYAVNNPGVPNCASGPVHMGPNPPAGATTIDTTADATYLYQLLHGFTPSYTPPNNPQDGSATCSGSLGTMQFSKAEYSTWRMISIRTPNGSEAITRFWDLPTLRTANEVVLKIPRVGFFTTPAFFAGWNTNSGNQARVQINQTMIVALGRKIDALSAMPAQNEAALDKKHAAKAECYACHKTLDPMRQYFRQTYSLSSHNQGDPAQTAMDGMFAFDGVSVAGHGITDLAQQMALHPRFARAWVGKLCYYANSAPCSADDPEFLRIADVFKNGGLSWPKLVRELFSSPLVTYASDTKSTRDYGQTVFISRRGQFCTALSRRLGLNDVCVLDDADNTSDTTAFMQGLSRTIPIDGYSRGGEAPVLANAPTMFFNRGVEAICRAVADQVVDAQPTSRYSSDKPDDAIADLVGSLMGLSTADNRAADAKTILHDHFTAAQTAGEKPVDALKSTFVLACTSPFVVASGF